MTFAGFELCSLRRFVVGATLLASPLAAFGSVYISVGIAPPLLPVYAQPYCPGQGYLWTPGYWAWDEGYFWVPGVWVQPPTIGYLWTPAYWGYGENAYFFHPGYWGPHIGFYGGVNYGFGYGGQGYEGGYWRGNSFNYNRSVNNINVTNIQNTYVKNVTVNNTTYNQVSYNGGTGGVQARPVTQEIRAAREQHLQPTADQMQHQQIAAHDTAQFAKVNGGRPSVAAVATPGVFRQDVQRDTGAKGGGGLVGRREAPKTQGSGRVSGPATLGAIPGGGNVSQRTQNGRAAANAGTAGQQARPVQEGEPGRLRRGPQQETSQGGSFPARQQPQVQQPQIMQPQVLPQQRQIPQRQQPRPSQQPQPVPQAPHNQQPAQAGGYGQSRQGQVAQGQVWQGQRQQSRQSQPGLPPPRQQQ